MPEDAILATTTIPGFSSTASQYYMATFASPAMLTAGKRYAFVLRLRTNRALGDYVAHSSPSYVLDPGATDQYSGGGNFFGYNDGTFWTDETTDLIFRTYMSAAAPQYATNGTLVSQVKDASSWRALWTSLSWTATTPASTSMGFQVAASDSASGPFNFVGPDGTAGTFFISSGAALAQLSRARYLKYKVFLGTGNTSVTPVLHDVTVCYEPAAISPGSFFAVAPCRLLDTRQSNQGPAIGSGVARLLSVAEACAVPPTATAVALNVTVTQGTSGGHLVVFPAGGSPPATSTLNFGFGQTRTNNTVAGLGASGDLSLVAGIGGGGGVHVIVDVTGYFE